MLEAVAMAISLGRRFWPISCQRLDGNGLGGLVLETGLTNLYNPAKGSMVCGVLPRYRTRFTCRFAGADYKLFEIFNV